MWTTYGWLIIDEDHELCGEGFFTALENGTKEDHTKFAAEQFKGVTLQCIGEFTEEEADEIGWDTY